MQTRARHHPSHLWDWVLSLCTGHCPSTRVPWIPNVRPQGHCSKELLRWAAPVCTFSAHQTYAMVHLEISECYKVMLHFLEIKILILLSICVFDNPWYSCITPGRYIWIMIGLRSHWNSNILGKSLYDIIIIIRWWIIVKFMWCLALSVSFEAIKVGRCIELSRIKMLPDVGMMKTYSSVLKPANVGLDCYKVNRPQSDYLRQPVTIQCAVVGSSMECSLDAYIRASV